MSEKAVVDSLLTGTLLQLTVNYSPKGITAPSGVGVDLFGWSQTQLLGRDNLL
jgi:hypothetical protein